MENTEYYTEIKRYMLSRIRNPSDAEDLTQQVFLEYYQTNNPENGIQNPKGYLFHTARTMVTDYYRLQKKQTQLVQLKLKLADKMFDNKQINNLKFEEITKEVENIISKLPLKAREAVELILFDCLSYQEAAKRANCSVKVLYDRFYEGLKIVKNKMRPKYMR